MSNKQDVYLREKRVGTAEVSRQGLYYLITCLCDLPEHTFYQLVAVCGGKTKNLGTCVPRTGGFGLNVTIPIKNLGEGKMTFMLVPKNQNDRERFFPVCEDLQFNELDKLERAFFAIRNGQAGVVIPDYRSIDSSNPTGQ